MILDPPTYACPTHGTDLTDQVVEELKDAGWAVAYKTRDLRRIQPEFEVVVTCPGTRAPHQLTCRGTREP